MYKVLFARFPYGASEHPHVTNWIASTLVKAKTDPRISEVLHKEYDDTPITMTRNLCLVEARALGVDYVVMVDSDLSPDLPLPGSVPFWDSSWKFMFENRDKGPCTIAAPYCGPPPVENVYIFRWCNPNSGDPQMSYRLDQFSREEAAVRTGIEEVAALPTGLMIIDMRCLVKLPYPYFAYEWEDATESKKATTEDVFFTRNLTLLGVPQYVNWDAWAGHVKRKIVGKPWLTSVDDVRKEFAESIRRNLFADERVINVGHSHKAVDANRWQEIPKAVEFVPDSGDRKPAVSDLSSFTSQWEDSEGFHKATNDLFANAVDHFQNLKNLRTWMTERQWGFGEQSAYYLWKLIVDSMPQDFSFLEIGVHRGQTVVLVGTLAQAASKQANVVALSKFDGTEVARYDPNPGQHLPDLRYAWNKFVDNNIGVELRTITGDSTDSSSVDAAADLGPYDVVYVDGGHDYKTAFSDIQNYRAMVKSGGLLVVDDCANDLKLPKSMFPGFKTVTEASRSLLPMSGSSFTGEWEHLGNVGHIRLWRRKQIEGAKLAPRSYSPVPALESE